MFFVAFNKMGTDRATAFLKTWRYSDSETPWKP